MKKIRKAVITAAGLGTRFLPVTKSQPKEMLPLFNKPLIQYSVEEAISCGIEMVVIVTAPGKTAIEEYFARSPELERTLEQKGETSLADQIRHLSDMVDMSYVQQTKPLGLGDAVLTAKRVIGDEPFVLMLPDDLFERGEQVLRRMMAIHQENNSSVLAVQRVTEAEVSRYGIIRPGKAAGRVYQVLDLVEKPQPKEAPSDLAIMGRYVLVPQIFDVLAKISPGNSAEIQLTDGLRRLLRQQTIHAYEFEGKRYDAGTPLGWLETTIALALQNPDMGPRLRQYVSQLLRSGTVHKRAAH